MFDSLHFGYNNGYVSINHSYMNVDGIDNDMIMGVIIPKYHEIFSMVTSSIRRVACGELTADAALDRLMD